MATLPQFGSVFFTLSAITRGNHHSCIHFAQTFRNGRAVKTTAAGDNRHLTLQAEQVLGMLHRQIILSSLENENAI